MGNLSRRSILAGAAALPIAAAPALAEKWDTLPHYSDPIVPLWREWREVSAEVLRLNKLVCDGEKILMQDLGCTHWGLERASVRAAWYAEHAARGLTAMAEQEDSLANRECDLLHAIRTTPATTPAGIFCKLDITLQLGPRVRESLTDGMWDFVIYAMQDLSALSGGMMAEPAAEWGAKLAAELSGPDFA